MDEIEKRKKLISYIKWGIVWLVAASICFVIENPFGESEVKEIFEKISNIFTVPGVILSGIGGLSYISYIGGYDSFGYAFSNFGLHNIWVTRQPKKYKNLYEYKQAKDERGRKWLPHTLVIGLASLFIGVIFLVVYLAL